MNRMILNLALVSSAFACATIGRAQSLKDLLNKENVEKVVSTVTGKSTAPDMEGTWIFSGSAIELDSDEILQKAGGSVAAGLAESKLDEQLGKMGITKGKFSFTFNADSTFQAKLGSKNFPGTYSYDSSAKTVELKLSKLANLEASLNCANSKMDMLFDADKLLNLLAMLTSKSGNTALQFLGSLAENYNGMKLGFALEKGQ